MRMHENLSIANYLPSTGLLEAEYAIQALTSGWVSYGGEYVTEFERQISTVSGFSGSVAVASGTCALQLAFELLNVPGTEVLMPAMTFAAPASVAVRSSLSPVFVDLDRSTWQICMRSTREFLERCTPSSLGPINPSTGKLVSTLCVVHLWGGLADLKEAFELAAEFKLNLVQDAAQCLGATYLNRPFGSFDPVPNKVRSIAATSFNANKVITTGAGGALLSNDEELLKKGRHIASTSKADSFAFMHDGYGLNFRMSNINAGIGLAQISRIDSFISAKFVIDSSYRQRLADVPGISFPENTQGAGSNYWAHIIKLPVPSERIVRAMQDRGIQSRPTWIPLRNLPIYSHFESLLCNSDIANQIWRDALMLPASPSLSLADVEVISKTLLEVL